MAENIKQIVEQALARALDARVSQMREAVAAEVLEAVQPVVEAAERRATEAAEKAEQAQAAPAYAPGNTPTDILSAAVASIYDAMGQADILRALLDGSAQFTSRCVLFVMKAGNISAWQSRGFENDGAIKGLSLSGSSGLAGRAIQDKEPVSAAAVEFDSEFINTHGNPADGNATILPLVVRDKVVALVYADAGTGGKSDLSAVRVLVRSASAWLEIIALKKSAPAAEGEPAPVEASAPPVAEPVQAVPPPPPVTAPAAAAAAAPAASSGPDLSDLSKEDQELHKKAKRFAKLLVDEIKLYNQAKVKEGKEHKDVYTRLKEDIDKSRATYEKRYGSTAAASAGYFTAEVIRILADNDPSVLGSDFPQ
jgi:hypothetical protein